MERPRREALERPLDCGLRRGRRPLLLQEGAVQGVEPPVVVRLPTKVVVYLVDISLVVVARVGKGVVGGAAPRPVPRFEGPGSLCP